MKIEVCDLCKKEYPDAKIKYKYRAKHFWCSWYEGSWERIDLCQRCLDKIIKAKEESRSKK